MARPQGFQLSAEAWHDITRLTGLTLTDVAERSEIPRSTLSSLLGGHHKASLPMCHRIASTMSVSPRTLFPELRIPKEIASSKSEDAA